MNQPPLVPAGSWLFGHALDVRLDPHPFLIKCISVHGSVFRVRLLNNEFVVVDARDEAVAASFFSDPSLNLRKAGNNVMRFEAYLGSEAPHVHSSAHYPALLRSKFASGPALDRVAAKDWSIVEARLAAVAGEAGSEDDRLADAGAVVDSVQGLALHLVAAMSAHAFLGPRLGADGRVVAFFTAFFAHSEQVQVLATFLPAWIMPIVCFFFFSLNHSLRWMRSILIEEIKLRRANPAVNNNNLSDEDTTPDLLHHMLLQEPDNNRLVIQIFLLILVTMRNTSLALTNLLYEVAANPPLREALLHEIDPTFTRKHAFLSRAALADLPLLDSLVRESLYQNAKPINTVRYATADTVLGGYAIPAGTNVLLYGGALHGKCFWPLENQDLARDGVDEYRPKRWLGTGKAATTTGADFVVFGGGRSACPGRFLGVLEIKTVLCVALLRYNLSLARGECMPVKEIRMKHVVPGVQVGSGREVPLRMSRRVLVS